MIGRDDQRAHLFRIGRRVAALRAGQPLGEVVQLAQGPALLAGGLLGLVVRPRHVGRDRRYVGHSAHPARFS